MQVNKKIKWYSFVLLILFSICPAYSADYFVDPNGNDTTGDGSIGSPYKTIDKAVTMVSAGDTIYLRGGTHGYANTISISVSGTSTDPITMQAYQDESVVVDCSGQTLGERGISLTGSYWHIKGFTIQNSGDNGLYISGHYNIAEQIVGRTNRDSGIQLGGSGSNNLVLNCDAYLNHDAQNQGENADGFAVKSASIGSGNIFRGCRSWNNSDDGFDLYYATGGIRFEDCWSFRNGINLWGDPNWAGDGNGFKLGEGTGEHVLIRCVAYDTYHNGIDINDDTSVVQVYNCTAVNCRGNNFVFDEHIASVLRNNISHQGGVNIYAEVDDQYNTWNSGFSVSNADFVSLDPNGIDGPRQADGNLPDLDFLKLVADSSLIDAGTNVGEPYNGSAPDLGAFEWIEPGIDTTPPTPDPMTWQTAPAAVTGTSITMTATTATDDSGVEYFFYCLTVGGHDSGWQSSTTYTDTGLEPLTTYTYQVKARDMSANNNETGYSGTADATTPADLDLTPPTPDPMTWATAPHATGIDTIAMIATTATDDSGVEYFFANITDPNYGSDDWQDSTSFTDTGLLNNTTYTYSVIARDKSTSQNETDWSVDANATTFHYICTAAIDGDLNLDCEVDFTDYAELASAWGEDAVPVNLITNGSFDTVLVPWALVSLSTATGTMTASFDGTAGEPAGSALISADNTVATNHHRFYQIFPVTSGQQYTFTGRWSGNIVGFVTDPTGGSLRNWAEVIISFESSTTPSNWTASSAIMYKKAYGAGTTNTSTGIWDWESITASPVNGPTDGVFTATNSYMVVSFNMGGRVGSGTTFANVDNISVMGAAAACPPYDLNDDCVVDIEDLSIMAANWLVCNRSPAEECWQ